MFTKLKRNRRSQVNGSAKILKAVIKSTSKIFDFQNCNNMQLNIILGSQLF